MKYKWYCTQPVNGMLIGRLFVQLSKGFSAVVRYLWRGRRKRLFAVGKERTSHLSVGMSPSFSTSPKIMDQDDKFFVSSLGGRFIFQVEHRNKNSERVRLGTKHSLHPLLLIFNRLLSTTLKFGPFRLHPLFDQLIFSLVFQHVSYIFNKNKHVPMYL